MINEIKLPKTLTFHSDSGHGWLAVKLKLLQDLGIASKVSSFSYINGSTVYLEEDCDASLFFEAIKERKSEIEIKESYKRRSHIRNMRSFTLIVPQCYATHSDFKR